MPSKSRARSVRRALRNVDDVLFLFTGKRLKHVTAKAVHLFGDEVARQAAQFVSSSAGPEPAPDSPYRVLGVHPEALDLVVKGAYRSLAREYHPDTGERPDAAKLQAVTEAYNAIMAERQRQRAPAASPSGG